MTNFFKKTLKIKTLRRVSNSTLPHQMRLPGAWCIVLFICSFIACATEQDSPHDWRMEIQAGVANDSTIVIDEIDNIAAEGGDSARLYLSARYRYVASDNLQYSAAYSYSTKNYRHSSHLDTRLHILSGSFRHKWESFSGGLRAHVIEAQLGAQDFLRIRQLSPYVSFFLSKQLYTDISYRRAEKDILTESGRSGFSDMLSADVYYFLQGTQHYWQAGSRFTQEKTDNSQFSFNEQQWRLSYLFTFPVMDTRQELQLSWQHQRRDFQYAPDPVLEDFRLDKRDDIEAQLTSHFSENFTTTLLFSRTENDSNNPQQVYQQNALSLMFNYQF